MNKLQDILDELQAQVEEGYAGPVNGWTTLKTEALSQISQLVDGCLPSQSKYKTPDSYKKAVRNNLKQAGIIL